MLVLTRSRNQSIIINDNIKITVLNRSHNGSQVTLGIDAPTDIPIYREEIRDKYINSNGERINKKDENKNV